MNDIEAFLLLLSYLLPFGGLMHIFWGIDISDNSKIVFGFVCVFITLLIMGYLLYCAKKEKRFLKYNARKTKLLTKMFQHVLVSCVLIIIEFVILRSFGVEFRQTILIICLSLVITTIIAQLYKKL